MPMRQRTLAAVALAALFALPPLSAQEPTFDVVSIKVNPNINAPGGARSEPGGRFTYENTSLGAMLRGAYGIDYYQVDGGPPWLWRERYDVIAQGPPDSAKRIPGDTQPTLWQRMMRSMLADRFKLQVHHVTREAS